MRRSKLTAWLLIIFGALLFLNHFDLFSFSRITLFEGLSLLLALIFLNRTVRHPNRKGLLGTVFFSLFLLLLIGMQIGLIPINDALGSGLVLLSLALANLICFLAGRKKMSNLIWSFLFIAGGVPFIIDYFNLMPLWIVEEFYSTYWPAILIIIGVIVLADNFFKQRKSKAENAPDSFHG